VPLVVPPFLPDIGPIEDRKAVDEVQSSEILKPDVDIDDRITPGGPSGEHSVRIMRPKGVSGELPVILYAHGAGVLDPARS
jgi:acetyl esterase